MRLELFQHHGQCDAMEGIFGASSVHVSRTLFRPSGVAFPPAVAGFPIFLRPMKSRSISHGKR
jgi:hypothetical protein